MKQPCPDLPKRTESANKGHPDKICDQISDVVLDACFTCDTRCKVACETCVKDNMFMKAGEITVVGKLLHETVARGVVSNIRFDCFIDDFSSVNSRRLSHQDCEGLFHVNKKSPDTAGGVHVDSDDLDAGVTDPSAGAQHRSAQQHNHHRKQWRHAGQTEEEGKEEKGQGEKRMKEEEVRKGEGRRKKGKLRSRRT